MVSRRSTLRASFLVHEEVDVLDFAGPLEIFSHVHHGLDYTSPDPAFNPTTIDPSDVISTSAADGNLSCKDTDQPRTIFSICTGALFLGPSGLLSGLRATHIIYSLIDEKPGESSATVLEVLTAKE